MKYQNQPNCENQQYLSDHDHHHHHHHHHHRGQSSSVVDLKENPSGETISESSSSSPLPSPEQDSTKQAEMVSTPDNKFKLRTKSSTTRNMSMKDLMETAKKAEKVKQAQREQPQDSAATTTATASISISTTSTPSLSLRTRVQERLARIICTEFCKEEPTVEIKGSDVTLTFAKWKATTEAWMIPKKARETFKAVSCDIILSIGTNAIREKKVNALLELDPNDFQRMFGPFTVAMGSAECMEAWIVNTEPLINERN